MSEINKKYAKRLISSCLSATLLFGLVFPLAASSESLSDYGAEMCANAGIPAEECTLSEGVATPEHEAVGGKGPKSETLVGRGKALCEQQGVPLEDCKALPIAHRAKEQEILPASSFLTVPAGLPIVDGPPAQEAVPIVVSPPLAVQEQTIRYIPPPAPPAPPPFRDVAPLPPVEPIVRDARVPAPRNDFGFRPFREPRPPFEPVVREAARPPAEPDFREVDRAQVADDGIGFFERFFDGRQTGRCRREVRYSRPPSYRYVECF